MRPIRGAVPAITLSCFQARGGDENRALSTQTIVSFWDPSEPECSLTHPTYILQWDQTNRPLLHSGLWFLVKRKDLVKVKRRANGIWNLKN